MNMILERRLGLRHVASGMLLMLSLAGCRTTPDVAPPPTPSAREQQVQTLHELGFELEQDRWLMRIAEPISFEFDRTELRTALQPSLQAMASELRQVGIARLRIEGHTDDVGDRAYNRSLSLRRSEAVAAVLIDAGFRREDIVCAGMDSQFPIASNDSREGRARNRRVDVIVPVDGLADD